MEQAFKPATSAFVPTFFIPAAHPAASLAMSAK
jgi:hypothetical protein